MQPNAKSVGSLIQKRGSTLVGTKKTVIRNNKIVECKQIDVKLTSLG